MEDEAVLDAPVADATGTTTPVETTPIETTPVETTTPVVPDEEAMWGDLKPEEPAVADPNAPPAVPPEFSKVLSISDYVREPAHVEAAVQTASEVWDVVSGKKSASSLLEAMRGQNPQQYEKTVMEDIIPYIEKITGKKFGATEAAPAPDPVAALTAEVERLKQAPLLEAQQREQQQYVQRAEQAGGAKLEEYIKAGNGIFDGDVPAAIAAVSAQFTKMGVDPQLAMQQVMGGNFANLEKAYKAAEKAETLKAKAYSDRVRAKYQTLKKAVPAAAGGSSSINPGDDKPDLTTQSGRAKAMAAAFAAGRDTL